VVGELIAGSGEPVASEPVASEPVAGGRWPARGNDYSGGDGGGVVIPAHICTVRPGRASPP